MLAMPRAFAAMPHLILLGDSIFDNGSYTGGKPDVIAQVRERLPGSWKASLLAVDGATTRGIPSQLARLPADASHLVLSIGGNDALGSQQVLRAPAKTVAEAMILLGDAAGEFEANYRKAIGACLARGLPLVTCTIYNGNFPDRQYQRQTAAALAAFNDAIIRVGVEHGLTMLDLRQICSRPEDYANPIEPSSIGGAKIAQAIVRTVTEPADGRRGARLLGAAH
ncbi:Lysophospholipase L1 [Noviherbaspirillum humi]|uniref:Lysophospholipase L1 n=2 Tax=Noviherbaspirillum humi TaxID=1688639 RepID=A0A239LS60_9BURK|nr:Lysophospholipase L1 [Noviherbaspirillum humi]